MHATHPNGQCRCLRFSMSGLEYDAEASSRVRICSQQAGLKLLNDRRLDVTLKSVATQGVELKRLTELLEELQQQTVGRETTVSGSGFNVETK